MTFKQKIYQLARSLGLGRALLNVRHLMDLGLFNFLKVAIFFKKDLTAIKNFTPVPSQDGIEIHMLLNHRMVLEGGWAIYSFMYFSKRRCHPMIHNDGTLNAKDISFLKSLFPGIDIISRVDANREVIDALEKKGFSRCAQLRKNSILSLKLFDTIHYSREKRLVILDSDVLFFKYPKEILDSLDLKRSLVYFPDNGHRYILNEEEMRSLLGRPCVAKLNSGVMTVSAKDVDWARIERYLSNPKFWNGDGTGNYYSEQTLWAMELTHAEAMILPEEEYPICTPNPSELAIVAAHYCGSAYWKSMLHTRAIPYLRRQLIKSSQG